MLRAVLYLLIRTCQVSFDEESYSSTDVHHTTFVHTTMLDHTKCTPSSAQLSYTVAQRRAAQCPAVWCGTVLRCAVSNTAVPSIMRNARYQVPVSTYLLVSELSSLIDLRLGPPYVIFFASYTRTADQK